jgi:hypothetical protein
LEKLRNELPTMKTLEWIKVRKGDDSIKGDSTPHAGAVVGLTRNLGWRAPRYEQKVNYIKAKIKNMVTVENARISKENAKAQVANDHNGKVDQEFVAAHSA